MTVPNSLPKKAMMAEFEWAVDAGYTLDNPDFKIFYLAEADSKIYDEEGNILVAENF